MSACIFFFTNLLLPPQSAERYIQAIPESFRSLFERTEKPNTVRLFQAPELDGYASLQWTWMKLTGRQDLLPFAPYLWKGFGCPDLGKQIWHLAPFQATNEGLNGVPLMLDEDQECFLRDLLNPILGRQQFALQVIADGLFATRRTPWNVTACPWISQEGKVPFPTEGKNAEEWTSLQKNLSEALKSSELNHYRVEHGLPTIDGFWMSGGGFEERVRQPTIVRCLMTDNPLIRGIADAAGLNKDFIIPVQNSWPACAPGERIVFLDKPGQALQEDNIQKWTQSLEESVQIIQPLMNSLENDHSYEIGFAASNGLSLSYTTRSRIQSKLFFWKKNNNYCDQWIAQEQE